MLSTASPKIEFLKAENADLPVLLSIYRQARGFMEKSGNPHQWGDSYPPEALLREDIRLGHAYLCKEGEQVLGAFSYFEEPDPTYARIYEGQWLSDSPYGVMHRVAAAVHGRGVGAMCIRWCYEKCRNLRMDTHRDNLPMQHTLEKLGFTRCGIIRLPDGEPLLAYQKTESC